MRATNMMAATRAAILLLTLAPAMAWSQQARDTSKYQPAILDLRACIRMNAPTAQIAGIRTYDAAFRYFLGRCYAPFSSSLASLGVSDAATGSFRLVVRQEWAAFSEHVGND